jgi:hypothetical protein
MLVSHFELLIKRIAPLSQNNQIDEPFRRIVQGYFLTITNLDPIRTVNFYIRFKISTGTLNRTISSINTKCFFDNGNTANNINIPFNNLPIFPLFTQRWQTNTFTLRANQTGLIALLPDTQLLNNNANPEMEVRGYIELFQQTSGLPWPISSVPVLLTAETRGTFLDNDYPSPNTANELDFDQIAYTLPIASGKAENLVPGIIIPNFANVSDIQDIQSKISKENPQLDAKEIEAFSKSIVKMMNAVQK